VASTPAVPLRGMNQRLRKKAEAILEMRIIIMVKGN
jgi:hypothetical protein